MTTSLTLQITADSDWHIGSGVGRPGDVDRLVARDTDGLPYVPAKTITGLWRDASETLAFGLDDGKPDGPWSQWIRFLFGDQPARDGLANREGNGNDDGARSRLGEAPWPAALTIRSARLPSDLRPLLVGDSHAARRLRESLFVVKPGVAIDPLSGRAKSRHLRFEERVRGGLTLTARVELHADLGEDEQRTAEALLVSSAGLLERMGGKRRRGVGRCQWSILERPASDCLNWLERNPCPARLPTRNESAESDLPAEETERSEAVSASVEAVSDAPPGASSVPLPVSWHDIPLGIRLESSVSVPTRTVGNVVETLDFIPGTYLLGHITKFLGQMGIDGRAAITEGRVRVLPCTIEVRGERGIPVPLCWFTKKDEPTLVCSQHTRNRLVQEARDEEPQFKQLRGGYIAVAQDQHTVNGYRPVPVEVRTHNTVDERTQRPTSEVGGVYSYEAIRPDSLQSVLRVAEDIWKTISQHPDWKSLLEGPLQLGRSKKNEYGDARLRVLQSSTVDETMASGPSTRQDSQYLDVFLLSDLILYDETLRMTATVEQLGRELEARLGTLVGAEVKLKPTMNYSRSRRIDSWHVGWGLPRASLITLQAGSCVRFELASKVQPGPLNQALRQLESAGMGLRQVEGFGQVCFDHPLLRKPAATATELLRPIGEADDEPPFVRPGSEAHAIGRAIEIGCWTRLISEATLANISTLQTKWRWKQKPPSQSQLGALRSVLRELTDWNSRTILQQWLDHLQETRLRAEKWPNGSLASLREILDLDSKAATPERAAVWQLLECEKWPTATSDGLRFLKTSLWADAARSLLDACIRYQQHDGSK